MKHAYPAGRYFTTGLLSILSLLFTFRPLPAQTIDDAFAPVVSSAGVGVGLAVQPDDKVLVSGVFTRVGDTGAELLVRLLPDGAVDPSFTPDRRVEGGISQVALQADGRILLRGLLFDPAGDTLGRVVRLLKDGTLDESFTPIRGDRSITNLVSLPNGKILTSNYRCIPNQPVNCGAYGIKMYAEDGSADMAFPATDFPPNYDGTVTISVDALAYQSDNAILVGGSNLPYGDRTQNVYRLDSLGRVDPTFDPPVASISNYQVGDLVVKPDGSIGILGGGGYGLTLLDSIGTVRFSDDLQPQLNANKIAVTEEGNFALMGELLTLVDGSSGQVLSSREGLEWYQLYDVAPQQGTVLGVGSFVEVDGVTKPGIFRLAITGGTLELDNTFTAALYQPGYVVSILPQDDGRLVLAGDFIAINGEPVNHLARIHPDGSLDYDFRYLVRPPGRPLYAGAVALSDGRIVAAGRSGDGAPPILMVDRNGNPLYQNFPYASEFTDAPSISYLAVDSLDRIYVGDGASIFIGSRSFQETYRYTFDEQGGIGVLDYETTLIDSLGRHNGFIPQLGGKLLFFGSRISAGGAAPAPLVRALPDGSLDAGFRVELADSFYAQRATTLASGTIVVAGGDAEEYRISNQRLVKLAADGRRLPGFTSAISRADGRGFSIGPIIQLDTETLLVTGGFDRYGDISVPDGQVLTDTAGNFLQRFLPQVGRRTSIWTAANVADHTYLGGQFSAVNGANSVLRLTDLISSVKRRNTHAGQLTAWPNPLTEDQLHVRLDRPPSRPQLSYNMYSLASGQLISRGTVAAITEQLAVPLPPELPRGAYLMFLTDGVTSWSLRAIR